MNGEHDDRAQDYLADIDWRRDDFCELWDELPLWSAPFGLALLERIPLRARATYVDIGAGTGFLALEIAQRAGAGARVIAVDPWASAMRRLERKRDALGLRNVELQQRDAVSIELPSASADVLVCCLGLHNFEQPDAVLKEAARVAKPGAPLWLATNVIGHMREFYDVFRAVLSERGLAASVRALDEHVRGRGDADSIGAQLERAGFEIVGTASDSFRLRYASGGALLRHAFVRLGFLPAWKQVVPPSELGRTFDALERELDASALEHGELALTIPFVCVEARRRGEGTNRVD